MSRKIFLLVIVCLVQGLRADPVDDVIEELMPEIQNARDYLQYFMEQTRILLDNARYFVLQIIQEVNDALDSEITKANQQYEKIKAAAETLGKNITVCEDKYLNDIKHIDRSILNECSSAELFEFEHAKLIEINTMRIKLANVPFECSTGQTVPEIVRSCIVASIELTKTQTLYINTETSARIRDAHEEARLCTNKQKVTLLDAVDIILTDFNVCVAIAN